MDKDLNRSIMTVGAHADDIEVAVGGLCAKYRGLGYEICYVMSTNNMSGGVQEWEHGKIVRKPFEAPAAMMNRRKRECEAAAAALGTTPIHLDHPQRHYNTGNGSEKVSVQYGCPLPEGVPPNVPTILTACEDAESVKRVTELILEKNPECIFTHGLAQNNIEHVATCLLVTNAFWNAVEQGFAGGLLHWREAITTHGDFNCRWETFIDCTSQLDRKMELIGLHACQMPNAHLPEFGHRILTVSRGQACGVGAAELFTWVRRPTRTSRKLSGMPNPIHGELSLELLQNSR